MTPCMGRALGGFQHRVDSQINGKQQKCQVYGSWEHPLLETTIQEEGFRDMGEYILKKKNTFTQYIATRPILDLCEEKVHMLGAWVSNIWCEQEGLDLAGSRETAASEEGDRKREEEDTGI